MLASSEDILIDVGLSPNEAKIYRALLELKEATIGAISTYANIHRRNTYDAIERLIKKGLAYQILPKRVLTYAPVHPDKLKEIVAEKNNEFETSLPKLIKQYDRHNPDQAVFVYKGVAGLKNYIDLELKVGKTIYGIGSKGSWFDPRIKSYAKRANDQYRTKKMSSKIIYDEIVPSNGEEWLLILSSNTTS